MDSTKLIYEWGHSKRYNNFSLYFRNMFKERVQKVSVDAGFTCPNRDGSKGVGGCIYCNNKTFQPSYCNLEKSITAQLTEGVGFFSKKYKSMQFLAYFQAYTNTYAPIADLKAMYSEALEHPKIIGLVIATRPDCLTEEVLDYLGSIAKDKYVMVELGVESCENDTLEYINRGHTFEESKWAFEQLAEKGIHSCAHMILGLPGETKETILKQAKTISKLPLENIKLHQLQIHKETLIASHFEQKPELFNLYNSVQDYIDIVIEYLEHLRPSIVVERFVSQSPAELLVAPKWGLKNFEFVAKLEKQLEEKNTWQGRLYTT